MYRTFLFSISCLVLLIVSFASASQLTLMSSAKGDSMYIGDPGILNTNGYKFDVGSGGISIYGTFNASSSEIDCGGNWILDSEGTFTASTSTVVFDGSNQTISGSTTFYGLRKSVSAMDTLFFDHNGTQTITGSLNLQGVAGNLLHLRSTLEDDAFGITYSGEDSNLTLSYLNVKDSDASGGKTLTAMHSVNAGNNINWSFIEMIAAYIKSWLEGPYDVVSHSMKTILGDRSLIPNESPYTADPVTVDPIPDDVTDWVLVELRETADGPAIASKSMFLKGDGDIISTTGDSPEFSDLSPGDYFVVVRHRNHLAIMSKLAHTFVAKGDSLLTLNLRDAVNVYGENSVKELETGAWGMYTGDANSNGQIQTNDKNDYWWLQVGQSGYKSGDFNLNGEVQTSDKNDYWWLNVGIGTQVP